MHTRGNWVNFFKKEKIKTSKILVIAILLAFVGGWGGLTYQLFERVQANVVIVQADDKKIRIYAPDWEIEDILTRTGVSLGERDRVQITKAPDKPLEFIVVRNAIPAEPVRLTVATSRGQTVYKVVHEMEATAYLPTDGDGLGITATGIRATHGVVAVDPKVIPLGSRVFIPGYGFAIAADTGGAIKGKKIDLCMEDYDQAIRFGRRPVQVYVL